MTAKVSIILCNVSGDAVDSISQPDSGSACISTLKWGQQIWHPARLSKEVEAGTSVKSSSLFIDVLDY